MTQRELAEQIARETIDDMIGLVRRQGGDKYAELYIDRYDDLTKMILSAATDKEIIDTLKGNGKFSSLKCWAQRNEQLMTAYITIAQQIEAEYKDR